MAQSKCKVVFTAEPTQVEQIDGLVRGGRYRTASAFLREAIDEKLRRLKRARLADQVERYCAGGHAAEDGALIDEQAFDEEA